MKPLDRTKVWKVPFIPDRGSKAALEIDPTILEFGRLVIEKRPNGKIRLKIGSGDGRTFAQEVYVNDNIITRNDPTTVDFGAIPAGTILSDKSVMECFEQAYWKYQDVVLNSISLSPNSLEIGYDLTGNITITANISNIDNLAAGNAASISSPLVAATSFDPRSPFTTPTNSIVHNTPSSEVMQVTITGSNGEQSTKSTNFNWLPRIIHLSSTSASVTDATTILAASGGGSKLSNSRAGDYSFAGPGYSHFYIPNFIDINGIGFTDLDLQTNEPLFNYAVQQENDIVINNGKINVTLYYFRSVNSFGGQTKMRVA